MYEHVDCYVQWKIAIETWAQNVPWIRNMIDTIHHFKRDTYNHYYRVRTEPDIGEWSSMSYNFQYSDSIMPYYCEKYHQLWSDGLVETYTRGISYWQFESPSIGILSSNGLWLVKYDDSCYFSRVLPQITEDSDQKIPANITNIDNDMTNRNTSNVRFLSIIYTHPNMTYEIELHLPNTMYYVGNELLSAVFVLRMLEYTVGSGTNYIFDMNYKLKIMDRNVKYTELSSNQHIELTVDTWKVCSSV
jgi:hypothetical protein